MFMSCPWSCNVILFITWSCSRRIIGLRWWNHVKSLTCMFRPAFATKFERLCFWRRHYPTQSTGPDLILIWIHFYHESMEEDKYHTGWWFGTVFFSPYIGNNHPNWLKFVRGVETTNQHKSEHVWTVLTVSNRVSNLNQRHDSPSNCKALLPSRCHAAFCGQRLGDQKVSNVDRDMTLPAGAGYRMGCCARVMGITITNRIHRPHKLEYGGFLA